MLFRWSFGRRSCPRHEEPDVDHCLSASKTQTWSVRASGVYIVVAGDLGFLTTLAFWLRSSVVSVLNSLTTIMKAPPSLLVI